MPLIDRQDSTTVALHDTNKHLEGCYNVLKWKVVVSIYSFICSFGEYLLEMQCMTDIVLDAKAET